MTFAPTPKADLLPIELLHEGWLELGQQFLSRLHHSQKDLDFLASAVADLYASQPGVDGEWQWSSSQAGADPGTGRVLITVLPGANRYIAFSKADSSGELPSLRLLGQGSTVVLTDDPSTPPTTAFRQYLVTSEVTDHGSWVSMLAIRVATFGVQDTPHAGDPVRLLFR